MNCAEPLDALVVGAGISGLSLAHFLSQHCDRQTPLTYLVAEQHDRVGGNITTASSDGFLWEEGPNSFSRHPALLKLIAEIGMASDLVLADRRLPRFVYWQDQLYAVPMSPKALPSFQLLSTPGKLRALLGAIGFVPPAMGQTLTQQDGEETVDQFFRRHLGAEVAERLVAPFMSGVYAGDANELSVAAALSRVYKLADQGGSLVAGAMLSRAKSPKSKPPEDPSVPKVRAGELGSFTQGLKQLPETIASQLSDRVQVNWTLKDLSRNDAGQFVANFSTPEGMVSVTARSVVLTSPAHVTQDLVRSLDTTICEPLAQIQYPPVACVVLAYPTPAMRRSMAGFGNLIPRGQGIRTLGSIWTSSLFPGRAPDGWQMLSNFIGGATDPAIADLSDEQIVDAVHSDLKKMLLTDDAPQPKVLSVHLWKRAIPQYTLGHQQRLTSIRQRLSQLPGLFLCSNYTGGVSLGDCVGQGQSMAQSVVAYLQELQSPAVKSQELAKV